MGMRAGEAVRAPRIHFEDGVVYAEPGVDVAGLEADGHGIARFRSLEPVLRRRAGGRARSGDRGAVGRGRPAAGWGGGGGFVSWLRSARARRRGGRVLSVPGARPSAFGGPLVHPHRHPPDRRACRTRSPPALSPLSAVLSGCGGGPRRTCSCSRAPARCRALDLTLLVNDGGTVRCNGGAPRQLPDQRLLDARRIAEDLSDDAKRGPHAARAARLAAALPPAHAGRDRHVQRRRRRPQTGARARRSSFARTVAQDVCGLAR